MHSKRVAALVVVQDRRVVQSIGFERYLPVGSPEIVVEYLNQWGIDEIILVDITASARGGKPDWKMIRSLSDRSFAPLTVGGSIRSLEDIHQLIHSGADKVAINTAALENPELIERAAKVYGNQCIVISIDARRGKNGDYAVFAGGGKKAIPKDPSTWAREAEKRGAGEILINSIDRDGAKTGFDLELSRNVAEAVSIPVIACGGAGRPEHFWEIFEKSPVSAAAAGNFFHFTEHAPTLVKAFLKSKGLPIRIDSEASYQNLSLDFQGRLAKRPEDYLAKLRFVHIPKETI